MRRKRRRIGEILQRKTTTATIVLVSLLLLSSMSLHVKSFLVSLQSDRFGTRARSCAISPTPIHHLFSARKNFFARYDSANDYSLESSTTKNNGTTTSTTSVAASAANTTTGIDDNPKSINAIKENPSTEASLQIIAQDDPFQATGQQELFKTLAGGQSLIFEMARKSILFVKDSDARSSATARRRVLPRWHPYSGVSDVNPSFRTQAPAMNNQGFAKSIWRNVRKRNKPSLWRHALRTYDRMTILEGDPNFPQIQRSNTHHEGAMLACAKLGLWQRALEIYHYVSQQEIEGKEAKAAITASASLVSSQQTSTTTRKRVHVTDDMILSLVRACVRASRLRARRKNNSNRNEYDSIDALPLTPEMEEREAALRRIPLDTAMEVLSTMPENHNIPLVAYFVNPLASAYQSLGYIQEAREILQNMLANRTAGEDEIFNVNDLCAKDKGSYSLLVQGAVVTGDWGSAVEALSDMTKAGLYPNPRHCNVWSEISERQTRPRAVGSWKKKRDDYWTDSVR
jgi:hypothetical protein